MVVLGGVRFLMSEVPRYSRHLLFIAPRNFASSPPPLYAGSTLAPPLSGEAVKIDRQEVLGRS
jgi:hypothetical protein